MIFLVINLSDRLLKKWIIYHKDTEDTKKSDRLCILCVLCAFVVNQIFSKLGGDSASSDRYREPPLVKQMEKFPSSYHHHPPLWSII